VQLIDEQDSKINSENAQRLLGIAFVNVDGFTSPNTANNRNHVPEGFDTLSVE
jgi:hypothetical protein